MTSSPKRSSEDLELSTPAAPQQPEYNVLDLVGVDGEVNLRHNGEVYKLRITRAGKLILTK